VNAPEILSTDHSGGVTTSHTIVIAALEVFLAAVGTAGAFADFERAVLEDNVLAKNTISARRWMLCYLRELYVLREDSLFFRAFGDRMRGSRASKAPGSYSDHRLTSGIVA
jgi:hypothetical protein